MEILIISDNNKKISTWGKFLLNIDDSFQVSNSTISKATEYLEKNENPDIIFLETNIEKELYISESVECPSPLVIISSNSDLCLKAFDLNTFDFLIKPITENDISHSIKKYNKFYTKNVNSEFMGNLNTLLQFVSNKEKEYKKRFMIKIGNTIKSIPVADIAYFFSLNKIIYLMKKVGKKFPVENTLDEIEKMLNPSNFYRANRQYIVNINSITEIHPYFKGRIKIKLNPAQETDIVISSDKSRSFKNWLNK